MPIILKNGYLLEGDAAMASKIDYTVSGLDGSTLTMLVSGQLGNSKATLYTAAGADTIRSITLFNTHSAALAVNLYINDGSSRQIVGIDSLGAGYHAQFDGDKLTIEDNNGAVVTTLSAANYVTNTLYDAYTILMATTDNTPEAITIAAQQVIGRITGGAIKGLSVAELLALVFSAAMTENVTMELASSLSASGKYSGITRTLTAGENVALYDVCYLKSDGKMWKAKANAAATMPARFMAMAAINADATGLFLRIGVIRNDAWNWTVGGAIYVSATTGGALTQTAPTGTDKVVQISAFSRTTTELFFNPDLTILELM